MNEKIEICKECGFPLGWERNPVFMKNDIFSLIHYDLNTCKECGHQKDGWTIKKIEPLLREFRKTAQKQTTQEIFDEFNNRVFKIYRWGKNHGNGNLMSKDELNNIMKEIKTKFLGEVKA